MKSLEVLAVLIFMGPLLLMGLSFIAYTIYSIIQKIVDRLVSDIN